MKRKPRELEKKQYIETLDALYSSAGSIKGRESMKRFLRDLLTESERIMLGRRILIARYLIAGMSPLEITNKLATGLDTVYKVSRWLEDTVPGYEEALKGLEGEYERRERKHDNNKRFAALKRKYPLHFLFFPWPKGYAPKKLKPKNNNS